MKSKILFFLFILSYSFYGQNDTISVVKHTDNDIIVNKELKIVYRGIRNNLSIEVPNCKSFTVSAEGIEMISKNIYNLSPREGFEVIITIDIILKNNIKKTEKHLFKIKSLSGFVTSINGKLGIVKMQKKQILDAIIKVNFEDSNLSFSNSVVGFNIKIQGFPYFVIKGNKIDKKTYEKIINKVSIGSQIIISDIKIKVLEESMKNGLCFKTNPIIIEVI